MSTAARPVSETICAATSATGTELSVGRMRLTGGFTLASELAIRGTLEC